MSNKGVPTSDWQTLHDINCPTSQTITYEMHQAKKRIPKARIRAVDTNGRLIDMLVT